MAPPVPLPQFVYKIIPSAPPEPIPDSYPLSELDQKDGFVHLSAAFQVRSLLPLPALFYLQSNNTSLTTCQIPITLGLFFEDSAQVWILRLHLSHFPQDKVRWDETEGTNGCPHLYGNFGAKDIDSVRELKREEGQSWEDAAKAQGDWLI